MSKLIGIAKPVHLMSGGVIALFLVAHLANHLMLLISPELHIEVMKSLRKIYHQPILWRVLLYSVIIQLVTGTVNLKFRLLRQRLWPARIQALSGIYLLVFLLIHIAAIHDGRYIQELDTNIYFATVGYRSFPEALFFYPYYFLAILALFAHLTTAFYFKMGRHRSVFWGGLCVGLIVATLLTLALSGLLFPFEIPDNYR